MALSLPAFSAWAGGLTLYEIATPEVGLASAGMTARAQDASTAFTNPAGMTRLHDSTLTGGIQALYGYASFESDSRTGTQNGGDGGNFVGLLPAGSIFLVQQTSEKCRLGFAAYSNFGNSLDYDDNWIGRYFVQDVTLIGASLMPSFAYKINSHLSVGVGANIMYGIFENKVAIRQTLFGSDGGMEIDTTDWGYGANLGVLYELSEATRFGVTYTSKIELEFDDTPQFSNLSPALNTALNLAGLRNAELELGMNVPQGIMASVYHNLNSQWTLLANVGWQDWSDFGRVDIGVYSDTPKTLTVDRQYDDTYHLAAGAQYRLNADWQLSGGVAYDSSMVDDANRTADLPVGNFWRFGLGGQYHWRENLNLDIGYELAWEGDLEIDQSKRLLNTRLAGEYPNTQLHFFTVNLTWKY